VRRQPASCKSNGNGLRLRCASTTCRGGTAFIQIERSVGGAEGDATTGTAQLLASYGRKAEAKILAGDLQERAQSALVRDKARALLTQMQKIDAPTAPRSQRGNQSTVKRLLD